MKITSEKLRAAVSEPTKILVYSFGCNPAAGFSADYLGLADKLMRCLQLGIGFRLCKITVPRGFITKHGWTDYFEPFCDEVKAPLLDRINLHFFPYARKFPLTKIVAGFWLRSLSVPRAHYFTFDDLGEIEPLKPLMFAEDENYLLARRDLIRVLWTYNPETRRELEAIKQQIKLPKDYLAICVRRGDKVIEHPYVGIDKYAKLVNSSADGLRTIFVGSDDARVIGEVSQTMPNHEIISLIDSHSRGYIHSEFKALPSAERRHRVIYFFAQLELMRDATWFIGSRTTNVSWIVNAHRGGEGVAWVD